MKARRAPKKTKKVSAGLSPRMKAQLALDAPVERDAMYWLEHAFHWTGLLFAVVCAFTIGVTMF